MIASHPLTTKIKQMRDFLQASYTAILSDLHLCEAEPVHSRFPLWKKYKTRQFFFDDVFAQFLEHLQVESGGESIELILNGDIFDFDSLMQMPGDPLYKISWLERLRGLGAQAEKSLFKIEAISRDHPTFFAALSEFIKKGNRVIFIIGNHDLELHFEAVQKSIVKSLQLTETEELAVRFCEWFYISNQDTLIEHGNQHDPYCLCEDPLHPFFLNHNELSLKLPFGNLACRYILNGLAFFNPHVDSNYIMNLKDYFNIFLRYMARAQPLLIWTWFWGAIVTFLHAFADRLRSPITNAFHLEDRVENIARKANATPRLVRELKELFPAPASSQPWLLFQELWLDRSFIILLGLLAIIQIMVVIKALTNISIFWALIPILLLVPFFLFYASSVVSYVSSFKEPNERTLATESAITGVERIVYGHTHHARHEQIGFVEHLNSGCWSPAFLDIECTKPIDQKTFVWISPNELRRKAELRVFHEGKSMLYSKKARGDYAAKIS